MCILIVLSQPCFLSLRNLCSFAIDGTACHSRVRRVWLAGGLNGGLPEPQTQNPACISAPKMDSYYVGVHAVRGTEPFCTSYTR
jgi:hypothetical protein